MGTGSTGIAGKKSKSKSTDGSEGSISHTAYDAFSAYNPYAEDVLPPVGIKSTSAVERVVVEGTSKKRKNRDTDDDDGYDCGKGTQGGNSGHMGESRLKSPFEESSTARGSSSGLSCKKNARTERKAQVDASPDEPPVE